MTSFQLHRHKWLSLRWKGMVYSNSHLFSLTTQESWENLVQTLKTTRSKQRVRRSRYHDAVIISYVCVFLRRRKTKKTYWKMHTPEKMSQQECSGTERECNHYNMFFFCYFCHGNSLSWRTWTSLKRIKSKQDAQVFIPLVCCAIWPSI